MHYYITATSQFAKSILDTYASATVHSVYRKTINLSFGEKLLSLQAADTVLSPISLITAFSEQEMGLLSVHVGDRITTADLDLKTCEINDLSFAPDLSDSQILHLETMLKTAIEHAHTGGFDILFSLQRASLTSPVLRAAGGQLDLAANALHHSHWETAADALCKLIGLGNGLTPSGDDFLCGVLAGLQMLQASDHSFTQILKQRLPLHLSDTNDISAAFLSCALHNQFSLPVSALPNAQTADQILATFKNIGHSSGVDTLCGIYYICNQNTFFKKELLSK